MSYYTPLITAWNNASLSTGASLPTGVTGSLLTGMTTAQKIAAVNAWTVTGPALTPNIPVSQVISVCNAADLATLTSAQLQLLQLVLQSQNVVYAPIGGTIRTVFANVFSGKPNTLNALSALVATYDTPQIPWVTAPLTNSPPGAGLGGTVNSNDTAAAGVV